MSECPKGLINDLYPGDCGRYVDENNNQLCDLSETEEVTQAPVGLKTTVDSNNFPILPTLLIIPVLVYLLTARYKKWWNTALIISFIPTALSSIMYILGNFGELTNTLHLYFGTVFLAIALCHILWHWRYFWGMVKRK